MGTFRDLFFQGVAVFSQGCLRSFTLTDFQAQAFLGFTQTAVGACDITAKQDQGYPGYDQKKQTN